jgi:1,4-alpha-glucan branching enzyme
LVAVPEVLKKYPETKFIFIGGGQDAAEFDDKCISMSLNGNVIRYNNISNIETVKFYKSAWALVFPTHMPEGMPMVVAESMSAGVPVITTKTRFALSYFKEPDNCLFIEIGNSNSISEKIVDLIGNIELRERMSVNNSKMAESFSKEKVCEEFISIYKGILEKSKN